MNIHKGIVTGVLVVSGVATVMGTGGRHGS
jgi:hypothetical protein